MRAGLAASARRRQPMTLSRRRSRPRRRSRRRHARGRKSGGCRGGSLELAADRIRSTAATDITAFLRKGIPAGVEPCGASSRLGADPAIRDFVGLAENAWDFNDPNAMPGFGPLDCSAEQLEALVGRIVGSVRSAAESPLTRNSPKREGRPRDRLLAAPVSGKSSAREAKTDPASCPTRFRRTLCRQVLLQSQPVVPAEL